MEVIGKNRRREQVNSKVCRGAFSTALQSKSCGGRSSFRRRDRIQKESSDVSPYQAHARLQPRKIKQFSACESDHSRYLPKRISSYPALPTRLNQVPIGKSTTPLEIRGYQPQHLRVSLCSPSLLYRRDPAQATIRTFYTRLKSKGKESKVALACMRKLVTILNMLVKSNQIWETK